MPSKPTAAAEPESWATRAEVLAVINAELSALNTELGKTMSLEVHADRQRIIRGMFTLDPESQVWHRNGATLRDVLGEYAHQVKHQAARTSRMDQRPTPKDLAGVALKHQIARRITG